MGRWCLMPVVSVVREQVSLSLLNHMLSCADESLIRSSPFRPYSSSITVGAVGMCQGKLPRNKSTMLPKYIWGTPIHMPRALPLLKSQRVKLPAPCQIHQTSLATSLLQGRGSSPCQGLDLNEQRGQMGRAQKGAAGFQRMRRAMNRLMIVTLSGITETLEQGRAFSEIGLNQPSQKGGLYARP